MLLQEPILFNKFESSSLPKTTSGVTLKQDSKEFDYYFWQTRALTSKLHFICQTDNLKNDIGCLEKSDVLGAEYVGSANVTETGAVCLKWNDAKVPNLFNNQSGMDHNFCRNIDGEDEKPFCFIGKQFYCLDK